MLQTVGDILEWIGIICVVVAGIIGIVTIAANKGWNPFR